MLQSTTPDRHIPYETTVGKSELQTAARVIKEHRHLETDHDEFLDELKHTGIETTEDYLLAHAVEDNHEYRALTTTDLLEADSWAELFITLLTAYRDETQLHHLFEPIDVDTPTVEFNKASMASSASVMSEGNEFPTDTATYETTTSDIENIGASIGATMAASSSNVHTNILYPFKEYGELIHQQYRTALPDGAICMGPTVDDLYHQIDTIERNGHRPTDIVVGRHAHDTLLSETIIQYGSDVKCDSILGLDVHVDSRLGHRAVVGSSEGGRVAFYKSPTVSDISYMPITVPNMGRIREVSARISEASAPVLLYDEAYGVDKN